MDFVTGFHRHRHHFHRNKEANWRSGGNDETLHQNSERQCGVCFKLYDYLRGWHKICTATHTRLDILRYIQTGTHKHTHTHTPRDNKHPRVVVATIESLVVSLRVQRVHNFIWFILCCICFSHLVFPAIDFHFFTLRRVFGCAWFHSVILLWIQTSREIGRES